MIRETRSRTDRPFGVNVVFDPAAKEVSADAHLDALALYAGQSAGSVDSLAPADEIVGALVTETTEAIERTVALV